MARIVRQGNLSAKGGAALCFAIGAVIVAIAVAIFAYNAKFAVGAESTSGLVTSANANETCFTYDADGQMLTTCIGATDSRWTPGKTVTLYYHPDAPTKIRTSAGWSIASIIPLVIGLVWIGFGFLVLFLGRMEARQNSRMQPRRATITMVKGGEVVVCRLIDPVPSEDQAYETEWDGPGLDSLVGQEVTVYVDPDSPGDYRIDLGPVVARLGLNR